MKGKVLDFSIQKNEGVISADNGSRYYFKGSDWRSDVPPRRGLAVDFDPIDTVAADIYLALTETRSVGQTFTASLLQNKSRTSFVVMGLFLGCFGVHNFFAGYTGRAIAQLLITILTGWLILPLFAAWIWTIVEVCTVTNDAQGVPFS